jgi:hypothetical protein
MVSLLAITDITDFYSDFNYERQSDYSCKLIDGLEPLDHSLQCKANPDQTEWFDATGYRRTPINTCVNGLDLVSAGVAHPCPGHEEEFTKKRGLHGFGLFLVIVLPILAAAGVGYYVWHNFDGKFGRIRLGDGMVDSDSPFLKIPIAVISATIAIIAAIPLLVTSLYRSVASRFGFGGGYGRVYNTRGSFARQRGDYAAVDDGELLGEDSDDEV